MTADRSEKARGHKSDAHVAEQKEQIKGVRTLCLNKSKGSVLTPFLELGLLKDEPDVSPTNLAEVRSRVRTVQH
jgi:hypothetical protein